MKSIDNKNILYVDIADSPSKHQKGLMFVDNLSDDFGMFFEFPVNQTLNFWGENTFLPLDIAFVRSDGVIDQIDHITPLSKKVVNSKNKCKYAIEANSGFFEERGIGPGDRITLDKTTDKDNPHILFDIQSKDKFGSKRNFRNKTIYSQLFQNIEEDENDVDFLNNDLEDNQNEVENSEIENPNEPAYDPNLTPIHKDEISDFLVDDLEEEQEPEDITIETPEEEEKKIEPFVPRVETPLEEYPEFDSVFDNFNGEQGSASWAEENGEVMRISYVTKKGIPLLRDVEPQGQFRAQNGNTILVTVDRSVGSKVRAYIMDRIKAFSFTGQDFEKTYQII